MALSDDARQPQSSAGELKTGLTREFRNGAITGVIAALVGAAFGGVLTASWDLWKDRQRHTDEEQRSLLLLRAEVGTNIVLIETDIDYLTNDIEAAKKGMEVVPPLTSLVTHAWEVVYVAGTFPYQTLRPELERTYRDIAILNQRIQAREIYRATNQAMDNYHRRRTIIDQGLLDAMRAILARVQEHQQAWTREPNRPGAPSSAGAREQMSRYFFGYGLSVVVGAIVTFLVSELLHWIVEGGVTRKRWIPATVGIIERVLIATLVGWSVSGTGGFIGAWVAVKAAVGWQRWSTGDTRGRSVSFAGLIGSAVSVLFGVAGGLLIAAK